MEIATEIAGLVLRPLGSADLKRYVELVKRNRAHLTSHGDYGELAGASSEALASDLAEDAPGRFGVWLDEELIGRVDLTPRDGSNAVLGYWLDRDRLHSGFATVACRALLSYGVAELGLTDAWAGVTRGNHPSVALLRRLGFAEVADMGAYTRFHLDARELQAAPPSVGEAAVDPG